MLIKHISHYGFISRQVGHTPPNYLDTWRNYLTSKNLHEKQSITDVTTTDGIFLF